MAFKIYLIGVLITMYLSLLSTNNKVLNMTEKGYEALDLKIDKMIKELKEEVK